MLTLPTHVADHSEDTETKDGVETVGALLFAGRLSLSTRPDFPIQVPGDMPASSSVNAWAPAAVTSRESDLPRSMERPGGRLAEWARRWPATA
jgi:hypothetical protein